MKENIYEMGSPFCSGPENRIEPEKKHGNRAQPERFPFGRYDRFEKISENFNKRTRIYENPAVGYQIIF